MFSSRRERRQTSGRGYRAERRDPLKIVVLLAAAGATTLATGLGAIPVYALGARSREWTPFLWAFAAGVMGVASVVGLLAPALDEGSAGAVASGAATGVTFLVLARGLLEHRDETAHTLRSADVRRSALVFAVLFVHSFPEGFAIGTAYASTTAGLGLYVIVAIALQNIPEGTSVAIPMREAGYSARRQFWAAVGTSAPQPAGALIAYALVEEVSGLLPFSFAFAAGAMLSLVAVEVVPQSLHGRHFGRAASGAAIGGATMGVLSLVLGV